MVDLQMQLGQTVLAQDSFCDQTNHEMVCGKPSETHAIVCQRALVAVGNMFLLLKCTLGNSVKFSPVEGLGRNHVCVCKGKICSKGEGPT